MVGLQIMVTIQSGNRQEFLQAIDMLCSRQATDNDGADDYIFEAIDTPDRFFYLKQWTDRRLLENFLKSDRFKALLGAIQVLGKLTTIQLVELEDLKDISNLVY
jgi:quinol monooxygenase YgiN